VSKNGLAASAAAALLVLLLAGAPAVAQDVGLPLGARPGAVAIETLDGAAYDFAGVVGKRPVVIEFWATWCPLCRQLHPSWEAAYRRYGERAEFVTVAVAVNQTRRRVRNHLARDPIPGQILWDVDGRATRAFLAPTTSYVVVLDGAGRVVYTGAGGEQDLVAAVARAFR
jgi:thiol-disulfide isomerase/thioredoxin